MSPYTSPHGLQAESFLAQSFADTAFEPQSSFNFGEAHEQESCGLHKNYMPAEDVRSHDQYSSFSLVNGQSAFGSEPFSFPNGSNNLGQNSELFGQTLDPSNVWPSSSPAGLNGSGFPAPNDQTHIISSRPLSVSQQHGQITPPGDGVSESAKTMSSEERVLAKAAERSHSDKSERARNAAIQRHAKSKKQRKDSHQSKPSSISDEDVEDKKEKYREKNRLAAAKCRAKKKDNIEGIEDKHRNFSALNSALKKQVQDLRGELTSLRTVALNHQGCSCRIARYNVNQAKKVAMGVDGIGSPTGYGVFGHDPSSLMSCEHGHRTQSMADADTPPPSMGQLSSSRAQSFAAPPSNYAFASVTTAEKMNAIHGGQEEGEPPCANYLQSGYGGPGGFSQR